MFAFQSLLLFQTASLKLLLFSSTLTPPCLPLFFLPAADHSRSEMDLSAPGSEPSDDALSLRSRSVPGLNETVSCFSLSLPPPSAVFLHTDYIFLFLQKNHSSLQQIQTLSGEFNQFNISATFKSIYLLYCPSMISSRSVGWWTKCDVLDVGLNVNFTSELTSKSTTSI